ncbi:MAG: HAD family hydrolase [Candidatus Cloacimonetes bacterium]|nr:HAD family hydrolase [Candidatus Cloacimonadota bacterium]MDY0366520.1 HAD family hydrolase [Candidatus Syntrophosphaera sp.]
MTAKASKRAVFLDRDGCISPDRFGYIGDPAAYELYPWTGEALRLLQSLGYLLILVTNQSGIARGCFDIPSLNRVHARLRKLLAAEKVKLDGLHFSPYFASGSVAPYNIEHEDRKPGLGMFHKARRAHRIDPGRSWMIGDRQTDITFGKNAGLRSILLLTGNGAQEMLSGLQDWPRQPDYIAETLLTAAKLIELIHS